VAFALWGQADGGRYGDPGRWYGALVTDEHASDVRGYVAVGWGAEHDVGQWGDPRRWWGGVAPPYDAQFPAYHVVLANLGLILENWTRQPSQQFASKVTTGATTEDARTDDSVTLLDDWSGGEGAAYHAYDGPTVTRYASGAGVDVVTEPGSVGLGPFVEVAQTAVPTDLTCSKAYNGKLYVGTANGAVYSWDGAFWTVELTTGKAGGIRAMTVYRDVLYVANGTDGQVASYNGVTWTANAFTVGGSAGIYVLAPFYSGGVAVLWVGSSAGSAGSVGGLYKWDGTTISAVQFNFSERQPRCWAILNNTLWLFVAHTADRRMGVYSVDDSATPTYKRVASFESDYAVACAVYGDRVWLGGAHDGRLMTWNGSQLDTPKLLTKDGYPFAVDASALVVWGLALWVGVQEDQSHVGLLRYDGGAWSRPVTGISADSARTLAQYNGDLYLTTAKVGGAPLVRIDADRYTDVGTIDSGLVDGRLPGAYKTWRDVTIRHSELGAGQSIEVQYALDASESWVSLGISSAAGATTATFAFSDEVRGRTTIKSQTLSLRAILRGPLGAVAPLKLQSVAMRLVTLLALRRQWQLDVRMDDHQVLRDGTFSPVGGLTLAASLYVLLEDSTVVKYVDLDRSEYNVVISDFREALAGDRGQVGHYDLRGTLALIEV